MLRPLLHCCEWSWGLLHWGAERCAPQGAPQQKGLCVRKVCVHAWGGGMPEEAGKVALRCPGWWTLKKGELPRGGVKGLWRTARRMVWRAVCEERGKELDAMEPCALRTRSPLLHVSVGTV